MKKTILFLISIIWAITLTFSLLCFSPDRTVGTLPARDTIKINPAALTGKYTFTGTVAGTVTVYADSQNLGSVQVADNTMNSNFRWSLNLLSGGSSPTGSIARNTPISVNNVSIQFKHINGGFPTIDGTNIGPVLGTIQAQYHSIKLTRVTSNQQIFATTNQSFAQVSETTIFNGSLSEGEYRLESTVFYKGEEGSWISKVYYTLTETFSTSFYVDRTAPIISGLPANGFTNGSVTATYGTQGVAVGGTGKSFANDVLTAKYSMATGMEIPSASNTTLTSETVFSAAGHYRLEITDSAGNSSVYTFTIDKTAPVLSFSGVTENGFTNCNVTITFSTSIDGIAGVAKSRENDIITTKYSIATGTAHPTASDTAFTSGQVFSVAGHYRLEITDSAGNGSVYYFTIDKTAPTLSLSGVANGGFTNGTVSSTFNTAVNGIADGTGKCYPTDIITALYTMDINSMPISSGTSFTSGAIFVDAGHYRLQIIDSAGNGSVYIFTIDKTAPAATLTGVTDGGATNNNVTISWGTSADGVNSTALSRAEDALTAYYTNNTAGLPAAANTQFVRGTVFSSEGWYLIRICDSAGNSSAYSFVIDKTKPSNNLDYIWYGNELSGYKAYTNKNILFAPTANLLSIVTVYVKFEDGAWVTNQSAAAANGYNVSFYNTTVIVPNGSNNGAWWFKAMDAAGNMSDEQCVVMDLQPTFKNQGIIYNSYKQNFWYNVVLPSNIFGVAGRDISGTYHASSYDLALNFAIAKEWEYRVSVVPTGWMYVNSGNGSLAQLYTDRAELDAVVDKYAKTYMRDRSIARNGTNNLARIIGDDLTVSETALTRQHLTTPAFLEQLPTYFMDDTYKFADPHFRSVSFVKIQMAANDVGVVDRTAVQLNYDATVGSQIFGAGNNGQGYYLITEWDNAGNYEQYYVYIDLSAPTLTAVATYGNNTIETVVFNESLVADYGGSLRYVYLDLQSIADSVDNFVAITINGRKISDLSYIQGDELPILDGVDFFGNYTIDIYDRSGNTLHFVVAVSGQAPYMTTTSLSNETNCKLTLNLPDGINAITQIKLYHILYDGSYEELFVDHTGTNVSIDTLQYIITVGGKYTIWYTDLFGRSVECTPIFYLKGLPTATLSGVTDGGKTNKNVSLRYGAGSTLILYRLNGGEKEIMPVDDMIFSCVFDEIYQRYTVTLTANEYTTASYVFFLYSNDDMGLFVEYTFAIDCIIAPVYIYNQDGTPAAKDTYTNQPFYFSWNESVTLRYYTSSTPGGELGSVRYAMNTLLTANGIYYFTLRDSVGNEEQFTILLDTVVSYKIEGDFVKTSLHEYIAKSDLKFTITEAAAPAIFNSTPNVVNGGLITAEGVYIIEITDAYGNSVAITIIIDKTPPVVSLVGVSQGGVTGGAVVVNVADFQNLYRVNNSNQIISVVESGAEFTDEGMYRIMAADFIGNAVVVVFTIDKSVAFTSSILNGAITTKAVTFNFNETLFAQTVTLNGDSVAILARYTATGKYIINAVDLLGNELEFEFTILPARVRAVNVNDLENYAVISITKNNLAFSCVITNGNLYIAESGTYLITLKNTTKNIEFDFTIEVDSAVQMTADVVHRGYTTNTVSVSFGETVMQIVTRDGETISSASRYSKAGLYQIEAMDSLGNELLFEFTILPPRVRQIALDNLTGIEITSAAADGEPFDIAIVNGSLLIIEGGNYSLVFKVIATGETFAFDIEVDTEFSFWVSVPNGAITTGTVSIVFGEDAATQTVTLNGAVIKPATSFSAVGNYIAAYTDVLGNEVEYRFTIAAERVREINFTWLDNFEIVAASLDGAVIVPQIIDGSLTAAARGKYVFTVKCKDGDQEYTFDITVDDFVDFTSSIPHNAVTTGAVSLTFAETITQKEVYKNGEKIKFTESYSAIGRYSVFLTDDLGNQTEFVFEILPARVRAVDIQNCDKFVVMAAHKDGAEIPLAVVDDRLLITARGNYAITLKYTDTAQEWTFIIEIDDFVNFKSNIPNNAFTTNAVSFVFLESITQKEVYKNGEKIKFTDSFPAIGRYSVFLTDDLDNQTEFVFEILPMRVSKIDIEGLDGFGIVSSLKDGGVFNISMEGGRFLIADKGFYMLTLVKDNAVFSFNIEIDNTKPTAEIKIDNGEFIVRNVSVQNVTATLTKNGKEVSYNLDKKVKGAGNYILILTDDLGNSNTYEFTVKDPPNWATYASIVGFAGITVIILVFVWLAKRRVKVR